MGVQPRPLAGAALPVCQSGCPWSTSPRPPLIPYCLGKQWGTHSLGEPLRPAGSQGKGVPALDGGCPKERCQPQRHSPEPAGPEGGMSGRRGMRAPEELCPGRGCRPWRWDVPARGKEGAGGRKPARRSPAPGKRCPEAETLPGGPAHLPALFIFHPNFARRLLRGLSA